MTNQELLPCPFCGDKPVFPEAKDVFGTCYDCGCDDCGLATMSIQIIDCFDHPRDHVHDSWSEHNIQYGIEFIEVVRNEALAVWNTRRQSAQQVNVIKAEALRELAFDVGPFHFYPHEKKAVNIAKMVTIFRMIVRREADQLEQEQG